MQEGLVRGLPRSRRRGRTTTRSSSGRHRLAQCGNGQKQTVCRTQQWETDLDSDHELMVGDDWLSPALRTNRSKESRHRLGGRPVAPRHGFEATLTLL